MVVISRTQYETLSSTVYLASNVRPWFDSTIPHPKANIRKEIQALESHKGPAFDDQCSNSISQEWSSGFKID